MNIKLVQKNLSNFTNYATSDGTAALSFENNAVSIEHPAKPSISGETELKVDTTSEPFVGLGLLRQMVAQKLNDEGYQTRDNTSGLLRPVSENDIMTNLPGGQHITSYGVICANP